MISGMSLRTKLSAPSRLLRYLVGPASESNRARYDAMSLEEKEAVAWQADRRDWFYRVFPSPFPEQSRKLKK